MKVLVDILMISLLSLGNSKCSTDEERLLSDLFKEYNPAARPANTVNVSLGLTLSQIIDVVEKDQLLVISAWIRQIWKNPTLTWNPLKYNNISGINVEPKRVWRPDIVLYNNADEDKTFGGNLDRLNTRVKLYYTGRATWLAPIILKSKCDIDVTYFPFDTQKCPLKFGSWTYDMLRLDLHAESLTADLDSYSKNSEWQLNSCNANRTEKKYYCCPELFPDVTYIVNISRRSLFYLCNLIFPMTIIGMLTMLSFLLPAESGERISLAITLLLAMTVFMLVVADIIPATSDVIPLVSIFFSASMIEMVVMIVVLCYIMRLHHKNAEDPPMSLWMKRFILDWLSYKVGIRARQDDDPEETGKLQPSISYKQNSPLLLNNQDVNMAVLYRMKKQNTSQVRVEKSKTFQNSFYCNAFETTYNTKYKKQVTDADLVIAKLDLLIEKVKAKEDEDQVKTEWRIVAMTIDSCLLVLFALIFAITFLGVFLSAPGYVP